MNPIGRRLGAGGFISSRMAERMAAIARSCSVSFLSRRASSSVKRRASSYNYFRDYDPATGRYIESDPIGLDGALNTYEYGDSTPVELTDPYGLQAISIPVPRPRPLPWPTPGSQPAPGGKHSSAASQAVNAAASESGVDSSAIGRP